MKKTMLCLALPLLAAGLLLQPAQSQKEPPATDELIQQLDSSSFRVRERAEQQLRERGPPTHLIVEDWHIVEHAIPFEFRDVPLP